MYIFIITVFNKSIDKKNKINFDENKIDDSEYIFFHKFDILF